MIRKTYDGVYFKALDDGAGEFEAIVSVFGNVDLQGDRVIPGAFTKSLERWRSTGDPIPVIWSHQWGNPEAHIGFVSPDDAREVTVEDAKAFGNGILGGLYVKGRLDVHKPFAKQVYDLLKDRRVKEWSFAYDVIDEARAKDGANDLKVLDVHEVGPTLKGANSSTFTLGVKSALEEAAAMDRGLAKITRALDVDAEIGMKMLKDWVREDLSAEESAAEMDVLRDWVEADLIAQALKSDPEVGKKMLFDWMRQNGDLPQLAAKSEKTEGKPWHIEERGDEFCIIKDDDDTQVACHATREDAEAQLRALYASESSDEPEGEKSGGQKYFYGAPDGSDEERRDAIQRALNVWTDATYPENADGYRDAWPCVVGTYPDHVIVSIETSDEEPKYLSFDYTVGDDGEVSLSEPASVDVEVTVTAKDADGVSATLGATVVPMKAGRVIGAKAASSLKDALSSAVDEFVKTINGTSSPEEDAEQEGKADKKSAELAELEEYKRKLGLLGN